MSKRKGVSNEDFEQAVARIREALPPVPHTRRANGSCDYGDSVRPRVFQLVRHVSKSGMSRDISTYVIQDGDLVCLDWAIGTLVGGLRREGVRIGGCGMDMGFALLDHVLHAAYHDLPYAERPNANHYSRTWL